MATPFATLADRVAEATVRVCGGQAITYTHSTAGAKAMTGIWAKDGTLVELENGIPVESIAPLLTVRTVDLPGTPSHADTVTIDAVVWKVVAATPDEFAATYELRLELNAP